LKYQATRGRAINYTLSSEAPSRPALKKNL
jgi:hypothetical protein